MNKIRYTCILYLTLFFACNTAKKEITDTPLYTNVINHYLHVDKNEEKKKAALFLFENMGQKYSLFDSQIDSILTFISDSIAQKADYPYNKAMIDFFKQKAPIATNPEILFDYSTIKSNELITHIDITFNSWKKLSKISETSFYDYCEFILPYRIKNEPTLELPTKLYHDTYSSFSDTLIANDSIIPILSGFIQSMKFRMFFELSGIYPNIFATKHVYNLKVAPRCTDFAIFLTLALRSIGIPAAYDYLPQWGNHHSSGHGWLAVKWKHKWYPFDVENGKYLNNLYYNESIPKVFRQIYSNSTGTNKIDVTSEYRAVSGLQLEIDDKFKSDNFKPAIALFDKFNKFKVVDLGRKEGTRLIFSDLGRSVFYFIGKMEKNIFKPLLNPVFIDSLGNPMYLIPKWDTPKEYALARKYPLTRGNLNAWKLKWGKSIAGSWIEASNDNFSTVDTLIVFKNYNSYIKEYFHVNANKSYKEIRFRNSSMSQIATLDFFDKNYNHLAGEIIHNLGKDSKPENIFDANMLTWVRMEDQNKHTYIGYNFNSPKCISSIAIQTRNDGNHIIPGDRYELLVYDFGWKSLGIKIAKEQKLYYKNVPSNGLYWLKNLSRGVEELPFIFDSNKNQFWAGQEQTFK